METVICILFYIAGTSGFNSSANTSRMSLNSSIQIPSTFPSIQLLGLEMLLHYFLGPEVIATATKNKLILSLGESESIQFKGLKIEIIYNHTIIIYKLHMYRVTHYLLLHQQPFIHLHLTCSGTR